jgi:3'-phosphoadenosine 5'-phosphosulfate sulfotransferase (PAPS reductase)/FAD synthetase
MERWELKQRQSLPLEAKITLSLKRIDDWYNHWDGDVYVSYSGGKDSTVLLDLVRQIHPDVEAVFIDTGLEYPEVKEMAKEYGATILKPTLSFRQVIQKYGYPVAGKEQAEYIHCIRKDPESVRCFHEWISTGRVANPTPAFNKYVLGMRGNGATKFNISKKWLPLIDAPFNVSADCCAIMKKSPIKSYERRTGKHPFIGTLACEGRMRRQNYLKNGCNAFEAKRPVSTPIAFWTENDVLEYIVAKNLKIASVYGDIVRLNDGTYTTTGCDRTGCMFCMFGCHLDKEPNRFQRLAKTHPKIYDYCMKPTKDGGLGLSEVLDFINVPYK